MKENYEKYLITAGGRIKCRRCQSRSVRSQKQCAKPSLKTSKTHRCASHGGASTGPKTKEGKDAIRQAHWKHGNETKEARAKRSAKSLQFLMLEMIGWHIGLFSENSAKLRGRKPKGFENLDLNNPEQLAKAINLSMPNSN